MVMAFPCNAIMLTNSAASPHLLGVLNGVGTTASAIGSAIGPAIGGQTFTLGMKVGFGILPWWTLTVFAVLGAVPVWFLADTSRSSDKSDPDPAVHHPPVIAAPPLDIEELGATQGELDRLVIDKSSPQKK